ncbi:unnamed protein product, partial [Polarella glacialis]
GSGGPSLPSFLVLGCWLLLLLLLVLVGCCCCSGQVVVVACCCCSYCYCCSCCSCCSCSCSCCCFWAASMAEGQDGKAEKKEKKEKKEKVREGDAAAKDAEESLPEGLLAKLRPRRRPLFFFVFVCFCLWIMVFYNPCEVDNKLKKDCGFSGVSSL